MFKVFIRTHNDWNFDKRHYYYLSSRSRVLPNFFIVGGVRCGTTSLYHYLGQHNFISRAAYDELGYFDDNYHLGLNWYRSMFTTKSTKRNIEKEYGKFLTFDVTTTYMESKRTAENIIKIKPEIKIIVILRNPIDRAYSQFNVSVKEKTEELSFDDAINEEINRLEMEISENGEERLNFLIYQKFKFSINNICKKANILQ